MFIEKVKNLFKKEKVFACIIWDGSTMKYLDLNKKEIEEIRTLNKYKDWTVTLKDEC